MDRIKSAYEKALERFQQRKQVSQAEMDRMEYEHIGRTIAAVFLRDKNYDLMAEVKKYPSQFKEYIFEGIQKTLFSNILPPSDKSTLETNRRAMQGILLIKVDKVAVKEIMGQLENLFMYYEQAMAQAFSQFKQQYIEKLSPSIKAMEKRTGQRFKIDPEKQPGFREEWNRVLGHLNSQYDRVVNEQKEKLQSIK